MVGVYVVLTSASKYFWVMLFSTSTQQYFSHFYSIPFTLKLQNDFEVFTVKALKYKAEISSIAEQYNANGSNEYLVLQMF